MKKKVAHFWGDLHNSQFGRLTADIETTHLIIGGGITGLFAAYFLLERGERDIVLIEQNTIGSGSTGLSAGMLVCEPETASWPRLISHYGVENARKYWDAQVAALKLISRLVKKAKINCNLTPQELLLLAGTTLAQSHLKSDYKARKSMHNRTTLLSGDPLFLEFSSHAYTGAERMKDNISINPLLFVRGLAKYLGKRGVRIYENTRYISTYRSVANTQKRRIRYRYLLKCQGADEKSAAIQKYLTTIAVTRKLSKKELRGIGLADRDMFIDDERRSFHYGKITADGRLLIGYGDVRRGRDQVHKPHLRNIKRFLKRVFPETNMKIEYAWSGRYSLSDTDLPFIFKRGYEITVNGAGTQLASIVAADYAVSKLLKEDHSLDSLFTK